MDLDINGIQVIFPFKPYDIQIKYMSSVITALQNKENALLESPTGTGKTLSLLCSSLAWLEYRKYQDLNLLQIEPKEKPIFPEDLLLTDSGNDSGGKSVKRGKGKGWKNETPLRIIYSSRTHSQLNQACNELKNCYYKFCPSVTIGSRDQLCINNEVSSQESISAKNQTCRHKVKNNQCPYHHNYERKVSDLSFSGSKIYDIEDLVKFGNEHKACPYYMSKALTDFNTSLTFMPYNYVLDPSIRKTLKLNLENCIIIFDEGHNIERVCEDSMSTELKSEWLALFIKSFDQTLVSLKELNEGTYQGFNDKDLADLNIHDVAKVKLTICDLEVELDYLAKKDKNEKNSPHDTKEIFEIMNRIQLDYERFNLICSTCEKIIAFVMNSNSFMTNQTIASLTSVCSFLEVIMPFSNLKQDEFSQHKQDFIKNYKLYTELEKDDNDFKRTWIQKVDDSKKGWTVFLWCMSPSMAIKSLQRQGVYNLIITSGTLSPLESFEYEMGIPFAVKLQNSHVISNKQLTIQLITNDPNGFELCGSFERRNDSKYYTGLGLTILELVRSIPKGIFIFFSSYPLLHRCKDTWTSDRLNIWSLISSSKKIFIEPKNKNEFNGHLQAFRYAIDYTPEGAIFMGVSRGKLSEGLDMGDDYCRAVIIVGLPYPARYDPKVVLKQKYLNDNKSKLTGSQWYMLQMKRALNQSIGRVVRHKSDYGMIVLCDSRFKQLSDGFSKWILPFFNKNNADIDFKNRIKLIKSFYSGQSSENQNSNEQIPSGDENINYSSNKKTLPPKRKIAPIFTKKSNDSEIVEVEDCSAIEDVFQSMKNNYTMIKDKNKTPDNLKKTSNSNPDSIFESFNDISPVINKRKQSVLIKNNESYDNLKKIRPAYIEQQTTPSSNQKKFSKYFRNQEPFPVDSIFKQDNDDDDDEDSKPRIKDESVILLLKSEEVNNIKKNLLITEHNIKCFEMIIDEICHLPCRCRQLIETLRVYSKKRNSTYLALRLNFILDSIRLDKRINILKDFSSFVPERERRHFLRTCKIDVN